jgi:hypothetical protein
MELSPLGDLRTFLDSSHHWQSLGERGQSQLLLDISTGMRYLVDQHYFHRDLKSPK